MEGTIVLETPDYPKTIDEINQDAVPKVISKVAGLDHHPPITTLQEKLEFFKALYNKKSNHDQDKRHSSNSRKDRLHHIEKDLQILQEEIDQLPKDSESYSESVEEAKSLTHRIEKLRLNLEKAPKDRSKKPVKFIKSDLGKEESLSKGLKLEVELSNFKEQQKMISLHNQVTDIENLIGHWEGPTSISESLSTLLLKSHFLNENLLEKIKEHSSHLSNDLDTILSNSSQALASSDSIKKIEKLSEETLSSISSSSSIPQLIQKLRNFQSVFTKSVNIDNIISKLQASTLTLDERITESIDSLTEIKAGIEYNKAMITQNLGNIKKRLSRI